nr:unnamed protein product [Callosobruchus analis]
MAKQCKAEDKVEVVKTGGAIFTPELTGQDKKILAILKENYPSIYGALDSNCVVSDAKHDNIPETIIVSVDQPEEQLVDEGGMENNFLYYVNEP